MNKLAEKIVVAGGLTCAVLLLSANQVNYTMGSYHEKLNTGGPGAGLTGAPSESNCTNCHGGTVQDGNLAMNVMRIVSGAEEFDLNSTITMELEMTDGAVKNGFQLVALNDNNEMAGSFTISDASNTQLLTSAGLGRQYVTHTAAGTALSSWTFDWNTPEAVEDVTFYVASNKTNNLGNSSGDVIYLSQHVFSSSESLSLEQLGDNFSPVQMGYSPTAHAVMVELEVKQEARLSFNVIDLNGKSVYASQLGEYFPGNFQEKLRLPEEMESGIYVATIFVNNHPYSAKIMVTR